MASFNENAQPDKLLSHKKNYIVWQNFVYQFSKELKLYLLFTGSTRKSNETLCFQQQTQLPY